ncbi:MAG: META domain-containing protein [Rhodobacteraceae bacterium]|nr:META domain-containing protein [Paracoccaceae bacterium]
MTLAPVLLSALLSTACTTTVAQDSVPSDYLAIEWKLIAIDDKPFPAQATIDLNTSGKIAGKGPCNRFFGSYEGPLPAFKPGALASTRMACPDMAAEAQMFAALALMTQAEVTGPVTLMLTGPDGRSMQFVRPVN